MSLDVLSMIPGVSWPAIPNPRASQLLALQLQLDQSQWLSPAQLLERQIRQLGLLYRYAYQHVPFYRARFDAAGFPPERMSGSEQWLKLPVLTRREIQSAGTQLHSDDGPAAHGRVSQIMTSGSTGKPITGLGNTVTRMFYSVLMLRQHLWHRRDFRLKLASIRTMTNRGKEAPREKIFDNWGPGTLGIVKTGPCAVFNIQSTIEQQADFLLRHQPHYLNTNPSIVFALAEHFERHGLRAENLREVRTFGEALDPRVRAICHRVWNVPVVDTYSSEELGFIALQCPDHPHYHIQSEVLLVEVLDEQGKTCSPGQVGRVVITSLHNFSMPLIRYEIGDYAEAGPPCPCGRGLPVLTRILGRERNMFTLADGSQVRPSLSVEAEDLGDMHFLPLLQYQLIQRSLNAVELLVVAPRLFTDAEVAILRKIVDRAIGFPMKLKLTYVQEIPRSASGKFEDVRSDVSRPA